MNKKAKNFNLGFYFYMPLTNTYLFFTINNGYVIM